MQEEFFTGLRRSISNAHIESYRIADNDTDIDLFARYMWNIALSEAFYPALHSLEVTLRNEIHEAMSRSFNDTWLFTTNKEILRQTEQQSIQKTINNRKQDKQLCNNTQLIPELNLGFWVCLFNGRYEPLWRRLLKDKQTFSTLPKRKRKRKILSTGLNSIRKLRNHIFHHEPIWYDEDLLQKHKEILDTIYWMNPAMRKNVEIMDRFPEIYKQGTIFYRNKIQDL